MAISAGGGGGERYKFTELICFLSCTVTLVGSVGRPTSANKVQSEKCSKPSYMIDSKDNARQYNI